ncbi:hypothetical protein PSI19_14050 [Xenorhabdus khoisanae]|uniref:hypothetical protein n=1 Tax=Xenorhabdus khoisanae TaxID=880157 RepID=UPI00235924C2|nr:hypothetical protein [Xenorhabdus khoisanae]MDC9614963.1 hypothetical protein [Xenorhabdus khoisanae]
MSSRLIHFEQLLEQDAPLEVVLPSLCHSYPERHQGQTIRQLCQELRYFLALEDNINQFPGFGQELHGIYPQKESDGHTRIYGYIIKSEDTNQKPDSQIVSSHGT